MGTQGKDVFTEHKKRVLRTISRQDSISTDQATKKTASASLSLHLDSAITLLQARASSIPDFVYKIRRCFQLAHSATYQSPREPPDPESRGIAFPT